METAFDPRLTTAIAEDVLTHCNTDPEARPCPIADVIHEQVIVSMWEVLQFLDEEAVTSELMRALNSGAPNEEIRLVFRDGLAEGLGREFVYIMLFMQSKLYYLKIHGTLSFFFKIKKLKGSKLYYTS